MKQNPLQRLLIEVAIALAAFLFLAPVLLIYITSLKPESEIIKFDSILPAGACAVGVFLLHQFFKAVPKELEEAAMLDGASKLRIWWSVMLPLSKPALATLAIFTFVGSWNDFLGPLVFLDSVDKYTLPVGIALFQTSYYTEYALTLAASVLCTAPILLVFLLFQRNIIQGVALTGLK